MLKTKSKTKFCMFVENYWVPASAVPGFMQGYVLRRCFLCSLTNQIRTGI